MRLIKKSPFDRIPDHIYSLAELICSGKYKAYMVIEDMVVFCNKTNYRRVVQCHEVDGTPWFWEDGLSFSYPRVGDDAVFNIATFITNETKGDYRCIMPIMLESAGPVKLIM